MSETAGIVLMLNNYFHDVATALLLASAAVMWIAYRRFEGGAGQEVSAYFIRIQQGMSRFAVFTILWIILGGIPRTIFFKEFEWANAAGRGQVPALIVKHVVVFVFLAIGIAGWIKIRLLVRELKGPGQVK